MANNQTTSVMTNDETPHSVTTEYGTNATPESFLGYSAYDWNNVSETSTEDSTYGTTPGGQERGLSAATPAVIVFSVIILILAIVIFGVRSKRGKRRPTRREKREEDETLMKEGVCKESIYLDVMPSNAIEEDEQQVERETPYVTLEFESKKGNEETPVESVRPISAVAEVPGLLLESLETRL